MVSFDGAGTHMPIGIHLLHEINRMMNKNDIDLYMDDGLIIIRR